MRTTQSVHGSHWSIVQSSSPTVVELLDDASPIDIELLVMGSVDAVSVVESSSSESDDVDALVLLWDGSVASELLPGRTHTEPSHSRSPSHS
jgi:hypothetical protein